jgi:hypothetical protein
VTLSPSAECSKPRLNIRRTAKIMNSDDAIIGQLVALEEECARLRNENANVREATQKLRGGRLRNQG